MTRDQIRILHQLGTITERQREILDARARGFSQYEIARALNITRSTVRSLERTAHEKIARTPQENPA